MAYQATMYRTATGEIVGSGTFSAEVGRASMTGCAILEGAFDTAIQYIWEGAAEVRPTMALIVSALTGAVGDTLSVSGLPLGSSVAINDASPVAVSTAPLALALSEPGTYSLTFTCWPYLPTIIVVTCT